ncbi:MAG: metallophosphoesterase [Candidatus Omnitrophica bacterium]|nr:metallophosphoesterase [Candidatus Omnitrophota bacterium]
MKIGLLSDTHDNLPKIAKAVEFFNKNRVELVIHAGDFVAPFSILSFEKLNCEWIGVLGNNDGEKEGLIKKSKNRIKQGPISLVLDNKKLIVIHDIENYDNEHADIIIFGHTHKPEVKKIGGRLLINPGEASGWLSGKATIAVVELDSLNVNIIEI